MWVPDKLFAFPECAKQAEELAHAVGIDHEIVAVHKFPDGESRIRVKKSTRKTAIFRSLHHPNEKLVEVLFAASALRDGGAMEIGLIAPYLSYMRQDIAFQTGEAVSQQVIGQLLAQHFDRFMSVDPHLHRTPRLGTVFQGKPTACISAAGAIAQNIIAHQAHYGAVIVGPDEESEPLVLALAVPLNAPWTLATKTRQSDRKVSMNLRDAKTLSGRAAIIIDDVISSGTTIVTLAQLLRDAGAISIDVYTTHALFNDDAHKAMTRAGVRRIVSSDSIPHFTNDISLARTLAEGFKQWL